MLNNVKYIYVDLDGTVAYNSTSWISVKNIQAFDYLKKKGIKFGFATGRSIFMMQQEIDVVKPELPIIALNGGCIYTNKYVPVYESVLPYESKVLMGKLDELKSKFIVYTNKGIYGYGEDNVYFEKMLNRAKSFPEQYQNFEIERVASIDWLTSLKTYKILIWFENDFEKEILLGHIRKIGNLNYFVSGFGIIEVSSENVSKGIAISNVLRSLEINPSQLAVFGDNGNDLSMFERFENSVAMQNADDYIKQQTKYVTDLTSDEDGFADFVYKNF